MTAAGVIDMVIAWPTFLLGLLVFGFAPGALLRIIVLAFVRDDPRRRELLAEVHAVPYLERPLWVVEQMEVALFEGLWERLRWAATGRVIHRWHLISGVKQNRKFPDSFFIPGEDEKQAIVPGMSVKLYFSMNDGWAERMWVYVTHVRPGKIVGRLDNHPVGIPRLAAGQDIKFTPDDVIDIASEEDIENWKIESGLGGPEVVDSKVVDSTAADDHPEAA